MNIALVHSAFVPKIATLVCGLPALADLGPNQSPEDEGHQSNPSKHLGKITGQWQQSGLSRSG